MQIFILDIGRFRDIMKLGRGDVGEVVLGT
jgi:hypothetical protein